MDLVFSNFETPIEFTIDADPVLDRGVVVSSSFYTELVRAASYLGR